MSSKVNSLAQTIAHQEAYQLRSLRYAPEISEVLYEAREAMAMGMWPERCSTGTTEVYYLKDIHGEPIAVFKFEGALCEYAAYRLDHERFAGVPPTAIATLNHPIWKGRKTGSLQLFIPGKTASKMVTVKSDIYTAESIRRTANLDIRIMNGDRHTSNIIITRDMRIVPIDHGFAFPYDANCVHFSWIGWAQSHTPFSETEVSYIANLDPEKDRVLLMEQIGMEERFANRLFVATVFLKASVARGLTPKCMGELMVRHGSSRESTRFGAMLERLIDKEARTWKEFIQIVDEEVERTIDEASQ